MLNHEKMQEIRACAPMLEIEESSWPGYQRLVILRALEFFQELQQIGGLEKIVSMADRAAGDPDADFEHAPTGDGRSTPIRTNSESEFLQAIDGKSFDAVLAIFDDHMETLKQINHRAYDAILRKIRNA